MAHQSTNGEESSVKRQKLCAGSKICAVSKYFADNSSTVDGCDVADHYSEALIGILDLDSGRDEFTTRIRLPGHSFRCEGAAFCALGSTLYVFEGWDSEHPWIRMAGDLVFKIDLSSPDFQSGDLTLDRETVTPSHPLRRPRFLPQAIRAPDNKILVFSPVAREEANGGGFEIYDPEGRESRLLPPLPRMPPADRWIRAYSFVGETEFLVLLNKNVCTLDLNSADKGWTVRRRYDGVTPICPLQSHGAFYVLKDRFYFTSDALYDKPKINGLEYGLQYPLGRSFGPAIIAPVGDGYDSIKEAYNFCIFRMGVSDRVEGDEGRVVIGLCCTDLKESKEEEKAMDVEGEVSIEPIIGEVTTEVTRKFEFRLDKYAAMTPSNVFVF